MISLSIIIPIFNQANTIVRAVDSVVKQMKREDELIIVDDGSTDGCINKLLAGYMDRAKILVVSQENSGVSAARNAGVRHARHAHLVFLDGDDWWLDGRRAKLADLVMRWPEAYAWSVAHKRVDGARAIDMDPGVASDTCMDGCTFINHYARFSGSINSSVACMRKDAFTDIGGFPPGETSGEDIFMWLQLALRGSIVISPEPLVCIERSLSLDVRKKNRDPVGFHYRYFSNKSTLDTMSIEKQKACKSFLILNGSRQIAGAVASNNRRSGVLKALVIARTVYWYPVVALCILAIPRGFWVWFLKYRYRDNA